MKSEQEIREKIKEYQIMQERVAGEGITQAEERYGTRIVELEWVLDNDDD